ncbi:hypothetical protein CAAN1_21S01068 [[Candida] anglica]|uniref:Uncharacterized protein n=1 Tax=[Candida] anglica TaxID=148631 RepID=A0ABP0EDW0_9ASCO
MQFSTTFSLMTMVAIATAAKSFGLVTIHSGSMFQYAEIIGHDNDPLLYVGSSSGSKTGNFVLNDDGTLSDWNNKKIGINSSGVAGEVGNGISESKDFGVSDEHLTYGGKEVFVACPSEDQKGYVLSVKQCDKGTGVSLRVMNSSDVKESSSSTTPTTTSTATPSPTTLTTAAAPAATTSSSAPASGECNFGVVTIKSGSQFQYQALKKVDSHPHVFSVGGSEGSEVSLTLQKDGSLKDQDGRGIYVDPSTGEFGDVDPWGKEQPSKSFSIKDSHLVFNDKDSFYACPSGDNKYSLSTKDCTGGTGIALHVVDQKCA